MADRLKVLDLFREGSMPNPDEKDIVDETAAVVERLRDERRCECYAEGAEQHYCIRCKAADLIERQDAEIERLRAELEKVREAAFEDAARIADGFADQSAREGWAGTNSASRTAKAIASALRNTQGARERLAASPVPLEAPG